MSGVKTMLRHEKVLQICRQANSELNIDKCLFRWTSIPFFGEIIPQYGVSPDPTKTQALSDMPPLKTRKKLKSFLGIIYYLGKFSPMTTEVCKPLWRLTSVKTDWTWNRMYQYAYDKAKKKVKKMHS